MTACIEQRHKAALTSDILSCIEDCVAVTNRLTNDLHANVRFDFFII